MESQTDAQAALIQSGRPTTAASLHDEVLSRLRDYLVEGNLPGGSRIPERQLCEMFSISRTPLREALKVLASEGLVDLVPNRGAWVRELSPSDAEQLFELVGGLEATAGRLACRKASDDEISEVRQLHYEMYGFYIQKDLHNYFELNQKIHQEILNISGNAKLIYTYKSVASQLRRMRYTANLATSRDRWTAAMREHEAILDALQRRDGSELSDLLFQHLTNKYEAVRDYVLGAADDSATPSSRRTAS